MNRVTHQLTIAFSWNLYCACSSSIPNVVFDHPVRLLTGSSAAPMAPPARMPSPGQSTVRVRRQILPKSQMRILVIWVHLPYQVGESPPTLSSHKHIFIARKVIAVNVVDYEGHMRKKHSGRNQCWLFVKTERFYPVRKYKKRRAFRILTVGKIKDERSKEVWHLAIEFAGLADRLYARWTRQGHRTKNCRSRFGWMKVEVLTIGKR